LAPTPACVHRLRARAAGRALALALALLAGVAAMPAQDAAGTGALVLVGDERAGLTCLRFDADQGALARVSTCDVGSCPSYLAWNAGGTAVYVVNEWDPQGGGVGAWRCDPGTGALGALGTAASGGKGPCHACVHPSGRWLLVANYGSGDVGVLPIHADGSLGAPACTAHPGAHAHMTLCSRDGTRVLVPCLGADRIAQYRFDPASGRLSDDGLAAVATAGGAGPRFLALVDRSVYCVDELASQIQGFAVGADGGLTPGQAPLSLRPIGLDGASSGAHVAVAADGALVLASLRGLDRIVAFRRDRGGALSPLASTFVGAQARTPRCFAISPDGRWVLVAGQGSGVVAVYRCDDSAGTLSFRSSAPVGARPTFVGFLGR
jgi:6-phosphogluconolactonase